MNYNWKCLPKRRALLVVLSLISTAHVAASELPLPYKIIDIHLDQTHVSASQLDEGFAAGSSLFALQLNEQGSKELFPMIEHEPNNIYLIRLSGTTPIDGQWIGGLAEIDQFALNFVGKDYEMQEAEDTPSKSITLHFIDNQNMQGWSAFHDVPASCCQNYVKLTGFYRFESIPEKQSWNEQYKMQRVEPNPDKAPAALNALDTGDYTNRYFGNTQ